MKRLDTTSLRKHVTFSIILAMLLLIIITAAVTTLIGKHQQEKRAHEYAIQVHQNIEFAINHYLHDYTNRIERLIKTTKLPELLRQKDREGLYRLIKPKWDLMRKGDPYLSIMHVHLPDGTSFLRLHKPEFFGDQLTNIRPMIAEIHRTHKMIRGYETGKYGTDYRILAPIFDAQGTYIGAFEIGLDIDFILHAVHEMSGLKGMIFIKEEALKGFGRPSDMIIDGYGLQSDLTPDLKAFANILASTKHLKDDTEITVGDKWYFIHVVPLKNFKHQAIAKILFFQNISNAGRISGYLLLGMSITIVMVLALLTLLVYRRIGAYQERVTQVYRKQIEQLDESENRFHLLYEKAPIAYQSLDCDGNILIVNAQWCEELGFSKEEAIGKNFSDFLAPGYREKFAENYPKAIATGGCGNMDLEMVRKDGECITVAFNGKVVYDEVGRFFETHCIFINITKQKYLQNELVFNRTYLQNIFDSSPNIMLTTDGESMDNVTPTMLEFFGYETLDAFKSEHDCICDFFLEGHELLQPVMEGGINWLEYMLSRPRQMHKVHMMKNGKRHRFIVHAKRMLLDEKRRSVVTFTDVTEFEEIKERLEYAVNGTSDGLWDWNLETNTVYFSPRWKAMLGYKDEELPNLFETWKEHVHPDDIEKVLQDVEKSKRSPGTLFETIHRLRHKDGHWVWILDRGQTIFDKNGKAVRMAGFHTDISELRNLGEQLVQTHKTLQENEERFQAIVTSTQDAIVMLDDKGELTFWNPSAQKMFGYDEEEFVGKDFHAIAVPKVYHEAYRKGFEKFALTGKGDALGKVLELSALRKGGIEFPVSLSLSSVKLGGRWYAIGIIRDITKQKALENELRASKHQFDLFMENIPAKITIKDQNDCIIYANVAATQFFGRENIVGLDAFDLLPKPYAQKLHIMNTKAKAEGYAEEVLQFVNEKGKILYFRVLTFAIRQPETKEVFSGSIYMDITKEYKDKQEISKLQQVLEKSPVSVVITDADENIEYINPWFCKLTGYTKEEVIGKNPKFLQSGYTSREEYAKLWSTIKKGEIWSGIFKNLKKNGEVFWESAIIAPVKNEDGKTVNFIAIKQEFTEQIRLEERLKKQKVKAQELGSILEESLNEIYIFDKKSLKFLYANKGARKNIGYTLKELLALTPFDIKPKMTAEKFSKLVKPLEQKEMEKIFFSTYHQRKDGTIYPVDIYLQQIVFEGINAYVAIIVDTTEREKIRKKLQSQEEIMIAQSRHAAMGEMIGMIAHQWRQPITVIAMGANNTLLDIELDNLSAESCREQAQSILKQTEYLSKTIDDFRNFFRPDKEKEVVKLEDVMNEAEKIIGKSLENNGVKLTIKNTNGYEVKTYSRELLQVFINLLKNAKEALVEHREKERHIDVMITDDANDVITTVCDNGGGIDASIIGRIFDPYFSTKDKKVGTGLGLHISKTIVEKHLHGTIEVNNTKEGACFKVSIPLLKEKEQVNDV